MPKSFMEPDIALNYLEPPQESDTALENNKKYDLALDRPWQKMSLCGPNSLYITAKLLGKPVKYHNIADSISVDPQYGCTLLDLKQVSEKYKLGLNIRKIHFDEIPQIPVPFIAHLERNHFQHISGHFVVVVGFVPKDGRIIAYDPNSEFKVIFSRDNFHRAMSGYVLCPSDETRYSRLIFYSILVLNISLSGFLFLSTPKLRLNIFS